MFRPTLALAAILTLATPVLAEPTALQARLTEAMQDSGVPAMGVLVIRHGQIADQAVHGLRAADRDAPVLPDDAWHIGSDAKAMTATLIARLVERGMLSWSATLAEMLPDVAMRPEYRAVTLEDLLAHRAGLRDLDDTRDAALLGAAYADPRPLPAQRMSLARLALAEPPIGPAKGESSYSNSGYVIAGAIAERATGKPFEVLIHEELLRPLGMTGALEPSQPGEVLGHQDGHPQAGAMADNPRMIAPAGGLRLSLHDWALFAIDQMAGEHGRGKLLTADGYRRLHAVQGDTDAALGWGVRNTWPAAAPIRMLTHAGSNGRWYALIALAPDLEAGVLVAANAGEGTPADALETQLAMALMQEIIADR